MEIRLTAVANQILHKSDGITKARSRRNSDGTGLGNVQESYFN
jgi:hypothetical protein